MNRVGLSEIKRALGDSRFRDTLPKDIQDEVNKYLSNPGCPGCSTPVLRRILKECKDELQSYFPNREIMEEHMSPQPPRVTNNWSVINCSIYELEEKLKSLSQGRRHIAVARYDDQVTVVVNTLEFA